MRRSLLVTGLILCSGAVAAQVSDRTSRVDDDGALTLPNGEIVPYSNLASPEARQNFIDDVRGFEALANKPPDWKPKPGESAIASQRRWLDEKVMIPSLNKLRETFHVDIKSEMIGGVRTDVITPTNGLAERNINRVLLNLHGGSMRAGARYGGQLESVPIASLGRIKVITIDYSLAPEHRYPAAEKDVVAVYRKLLEIYPSENIGIYGCSSGAQLAGDAVARLIEEREPAPAAVGMFGWGAIGKNAYGDSNHTFTGGTPHIHGRDAADYFVDLDREDKNIFPLEREDIQKQFPPTLLISGTRDPGLSRTVFTHAHFTDIGVVADLHVWEGVQHCSFAQPFVDPRVPESRQAWRVIIDFFEKHLGERPKDR